MMRNLKNENQTLKNELCEILKFEKMKSDEAQTLKK